MTNNQKLYRGFSKVAWAYLFIYLDLKIGPVSLIPAFIGYLFFGQAIDDLKDEKPELPLLFPMCVILTLWHTVDWLASWGWINLSGKLPFFALLAGLSNLYLQFHILTDLASIAAKYHCEQDAILLKLRTIETVMLTVILVVTALRPWLFGAWSAVYISMIVIHLFIIACVIKILFDMRARFAQDKESPETTTDQK